MTASRATDPNHKERAAQHRNPPVPSRHGVDLRRSAAMGARLRQMIRVDPRPSDEDWRTLGQALWRGDPLADAVADAMRASAAPPRWSDLERVLAQGPQAVPEHWPALRALLAQVWADPPWLDRRVLQRGAHVLQASGLHGMMVLRDAGLMAGYQGSAINQTLLKTGALHKGAQRRVAETTDWWLSCLADDGLLPGGEGFRATLRVRMIHAHVRAHVDGMPDWDRARWGLPINQVDMQATYLAFSVVQLLSLRVTGVWISKADSRAVMHLWRYIGWLMGVEEELMCDDEHEGRVLLYRNVLSQAPADESSVLLGRALMDEPLARHYPNAAWLRGRFNRARHLSLVRWFVGADGMKRLGLPRAIPWYPMAMMLPLALRSVLLCAPEALQGPWRRWMHGRQRRYLGVLMGPPRT